MEEIIKFNRNFLKSALGYSDIREESDMSRGIPQPPIEKPYEKEDSLLFKLPRINREKVPDKAFYDCTFERCSRRMYNKKPLTLFELSFLLHTTQGVKKIIPGFRRFLKDGRNYLRPAPSVTNPFETYLLLLNVEGLEQGLYRYLPLSHQLLFIKEVENPRSNLIDIFSFPGQNKSFTTEAAALFFWSALPGRGEWRSKEHIHKVILLDLGHLAQNFYLAAEALGCGCCEIAGYYQDQADRLLEIDGQEEFTVLCAAVGHIDEDQKDIYRHLPDLRDLS